MGTDKWKIDEFLEILKEEIVAHESCSLMKIQDHSEYRNDSYFTGSRVLKCSFCKQNHFLDKGTVVTDLDKRKEIVWKNRLFFKFLYPGHSINHIKRKINVFRANHRTTTLPFVKNYSHQLHKPPKPKMNPTTEKSRFVQ